MKTTESMVKFETMPPTKTIEIIVKSETMTRLIAIEMARFYKLVNW